MKASTNERIKYWTNRLDELFRIDNTEKYIATAEGIANYIAQLEAKAARYDEQERNRTEREE